MWFWRRYFFSFSVLTVSFGLGLDLDSNLFGLGLDSDSNHFGLGLDSDSNLFGLGLVLDSTKVDLTTALCQRDYIINRAELPHRELLTMHASRTSRACSMPKQKTQQSCGIGCQITRTRIHTLPKRLASARHDNKRKTVFLPECTLQTKQSVKTKKRMMYSPGGPYIVVVPVVTSWAVADQQVVFLHMYLQTRVTLRAFPIATPRGRSSKFPWRGTWFWSYLFFQINSSYITLFTVFKRYSVSTITEILPVFTGFIYVWLTNIHHINLLVYVNIV